MNLIVAVTKNYAIGKNNDLLFHLPSDMKYFKEKTTGKVVVMGERTYLSLPKRPLKDRTNIVLSDKADFSAEGAIVVHSVDELFQTLKRFSAQDVFVCGGASVYNLLMPYCQQAFVTKIDAIVPADTYINDVEKQGFILIEQSEPITENGQTFCFQIYKNPNPKQYF